MQHPEYIYWAAVCLIAWPASLFSRCAGILAATWAVGQAAYVFGMPEPETQVALYMMAGVATFANSRSANCRLVAAFYLPLAMFSALTLIAPASVWWGIFGTAMVQVMLVPFTVDWQEVKEVRRAFKDRRKWDDVLYRMRRVTCF